MLTDEAIEKLMDVEEKRHRRAVQALREKAAYNLGRKRFLDEQAAANKRNARVKDAREARP
jgi:hypothetical protein